MTTCAYHSVSGPSESPSAAGSWVSVVVKLRQAPVSLTFSCSRARIRIVRLHKLILCRGSEITQAEYTASYLSAHDMNKSCMH